MFLLTTLATLAVALAVPPPAEPTAGGCFDSVEQFALWSSRYYLAPEPDKIVCSLRSGSSLYETASDNSPLAYFYAAVLRANPQLAARFFDRASENEPERPLALHALWVADTEETKALVARAREKWRSPDIDRLVERLESMKTLDPLERLTGDPAAVEEVWGLFQATGDESLVGRVASLVHLQEDGHGVEILVGQAAHWSLKNMVERHQRVRAEVSRLAARADGVTRLILESILAPPRSGDQ